MKFPDYFEESKKFKMLHGNNGKSIEYFHELNSIRNIHLNIDQVFFLHVIEGTVRLQSPNGIFNVESGMSAVINVGPYIMSEYVSSQNSSFKAYLFFLSESVLERFHVDNYEDRMQLSDDVKRNVALIEPSKFITLFVDSLNLLFKSCESKSQIEKLMNIKSEELIYFLSMNENKHEINSLLRPSVNTEISKMKKVVEYNYRNNLSLEQYAFLCNMSLSSFKRKFASVYETTPAKWIKEKRLDFAIDILKTGEYKINEVAYKSGFDNPRTFSKLFNAKYGMMPKTFLKNQIAS